MAMHRGGQNRARQKYWPGQDAAAVRELKRAQDGTPDDPPPKKVDSAKLLEHIAMPDWEKRLRPLFLFMGSQPYRIRALQNVAYAMFLSEADSFGEAVKNISPTNEGHLCGLHARLQHGGLRGIFGRLRGCKAYTDSVSKAFTEYVEWIHPYPCVYQPVPLLSQRRGDGNHAWWREDAPNSLRIHVPRPVAPAVLAYPYVRGEAKPEHELLLKVHGLIPSRIQGDLRADLCQDMFVALLSGEIQLEQIPASVKAFAKEARKIAPNRWRDVPLDFVNDEDGRKEHQRIPMHRHTPDFADELCEALLVHEEESGVPAALWDEEGIVHRRIGGRGQWRGYTRVCKDKRQFEDREAASVFLQLQPEIDRIRMHPYHCGFCRTWHLGHDVDKEKKYREVESALIAPRRTQAEIRESEARMNLEERKQDVRRQRPKWKKIRGEWA